MRQILHLTLVQPYYRQNALFIFVVLMGAFGFLSATEHFTLIRHALSQPTILYLVFLFWFLHGIKITSFTLHALGMRENEFLHHLQLYTTRQRFVAFFGVQFQMVQLTFLYAVCMAAIAWKEEKLGVGVLLLLFHFLLCFLGAWAMERKFSRPEWRLPRIFPVGIVRFPSWSFYPYYLLTRQTVLFFLSKAFGGMVLLAVCVLYPTDDYDVRLLGLGALMAAFSLTVIFQNWIFFERRYLDFVRNLPLGLWQRFLQNALGVLLLVLPEAVVLVRYWPAGLTVVEFLSVLTLLYGVSLGLYFYQRWDGASENIKPIVYTAIGLCILVMFRLPLVAVGLGAGIGAYFLFRRYYYEEE